MSTNKRENTALHTDIQTLIAENKSNSQIKAELYPKYGNLDKAMIKWQREKMNRSTPVARGRKRKISEEEERIVVEELNKTSSQRNTKEIGKLMHEVHKQNEIKHKGQMREDFKMGNSTVRTYARRMAPEVVNKPIIRNTRREQAMNDLYNGISQVVLTHVIQDCVPNNEDPEPLRFNSKTNSLRIHPSDTYNFDAVCCELNGDIIETIRMVSGKKRTLKENNLSASITQSLGQKRSIKQIYLTSADGFLLAAILVIRDRAVSNIHFHKLDNSGGYQLWLVFSPAAPVNESDSAGNNSVPQEAAIRS